MITRRSIQIYIFALTVLAISFSVMFGWLGNFKGLLSIIPGAPTMKFNTAVLFTLSAFGILSSLQKRKQFLILNYLLGGIIVLISFSTLLQYFTNLNFGLDNYFIQDTYSLRYPGRMSRATAICFSLLGTALLTSRSTLKPVKAVTKSCLGLIALISLLVILTYILQSVSSSGVLLFNSMALHTSISFFILSLALSIKNPRNTYVDLLSGTRVGSKLARSLLPVLVILPLILSFSLLHFVDVSKLNTDPGITLYTIAFATIALIYGSWIAYRLNKESDDRKHLESSLIKINEELQSTIRFKRELVRTSPETIMILNLNDQNIRYINKDIYPEEGLTRKKILGTPIVEIIPYVHPRDRERVMEFHKKILKSADDDIHDIELRLQLKPNNWEWFSVRGKIFHRRDEAWVDEYVLLVRNINQQKETQKALINAEKFSIMGDVARTLAHELRNPITSIGMASEVLSKKLEKSQISGGSEKYFKILENSTKTLNDLVNNLLNSSNYNQIILEKCDLAGIVEKTLEKAADRIYLAGIELNKNYKGSFPVLADPDKLEIALLNVIVNASEAVVPDEGIICIEISEKEKDIILRISDNGHGLEKEQKEKLFDAFYTTKKTGVGVGLNSVKNILEEHDSRIEVCSEPNKGTSFFIYFPKVN
ncbi:MAG: ATP-binding protein [Christiangramia sp.]|nr:ATP-binding protein [Christiangramia sp.]